MLREKNLTFGNPGQFSHKFTDLLTLKPFSFKKEFESLKITQGESQVMEGN